MSTRCASPPARSRRSPTAPPPANSTNLSIRTAAGLIVDEPNYSKLASRLLATVVDKEVRNQNIPWFSESIKVGFDAEGIVSQEVYDFVEANAPELNAAINSDRDRHFEFFGLRTVYDRYLLRHPDLRDVIETPQYFFLRVACGLVAGDEQGRFTGDVSEAVKFYDLMSSLAYLPSSPTLFNSGTTHSQMSSCYLLDSPEDSLEGIYKRYTDIAKLSKFAGGIGVAWHRIRAKGSLITGTNGLSNGIVPWLRTLDSSVAAVNQGGRRKGAACVYLESWHADIEDFLELRDNTGDHARRTHNLNIANWVPDLFMERVEKDWQWSLFDPKQAPQLTDLYGEEFESEYLKLEEAGAFERQIPARQLYSKMMRTLAQTGNGWMTFKDASNEKCNQTGATNDDGSATCRALVEPVHRDPRGHRPGQHCGVQPRFAQPRVVRERPERSGSGRVRLRSSGSSRSPGRTVPRPGHRHQLLPDARGGVLEQQVASGRARPHGPAGRLLQEGSGVRFARCKGSQPHASAHTSTSMRCGRRPTSPRRTARTKRSTAPVRRQGDLQFDLWSMPLEGRSESAMVQSRPPAELDWDSHCEPASRRSVCATRC